MPEVVAEALEVLEGSGEGESKQVERREKTGRESACTQCQQTDNLLCTKKRLNNFTIFELYYSQK